MTASPKTNFGLKHATDTSTAQWIYVGCLKVGRMYTRVGLLQATYTFVNFWKENQTVNKLCREYWYGRPESLQTQTLAKNSEKR
jgi:hypothetical protein